MNLIAHVEIPVTDLERAMHFYQAVFGVTFGDVVTIHGSRMAYVPFEEGKDGASGVLAQGSEILFAKTAINDTGFVAEIADSEGNRIAIQSI